MNTEKRKEVTIVSGLPRSGTSMMMKMLEAGGMPVLIDNVREADEDNPKGYYEYERVKQLPQDTAWLPEAQGKVVKMVFTLLHDLPEGYEYRIIFMRRRIEEILASQNKMLERNGKDTDVDDEEMADGFRMLLERTVSWLADQPHMKVEYVWYHDVLENPDKAIMQVNSLLGGDLDEVAMRSVVDESLYRNRAS